MHLARLLGQDLLPATSRTYQRLVSIQRIMHKVALSQLSLDKIVLEPEELAFVSRLAETSPLNDSAILFRLAKELANHRLTDYS